MAKEQKIVDGIPLDPRDNLEFYTKTAVNSGEWTDAEIRREYSRLRDIAQKRLKRLGEAAPDSFAYQKNVGQYPVLAELGTEGAREKLPQLARFIAAKTGTVRGLKEQQSKAVETLQSHGYVFIDKSNIRQFGEFMEEYRARHELHNIGSPTVAELFNLAIERHINIEEIKKNFTVWLQALPDLKQIPPIEQKTRYNPETGRREKTSATSKDYLAEVNKLRKMQRKPPLRRKSKKK